jgi:hypothetical protein
VVTASTAATTTRSSAASTWFYHEASGGKFVPGAVLFDLELGVIGALTPICRSASSSARITREPKRGREKQLGQGPLHRGRARSLLNLTIVQRFCLSVCVFMGPELARCVH